MEVSLQMRSCNRRKAGAAPAAAMAVARELQDQPEAELRRGPWTVDEDLTLINYISDHGEGRWNALARAAGLRRTGKSCRLRWLNYLRPDVKRGNFTADEQLLILDLHSRWGNRWSKIAQHLPGRTDNEIKNYWRTRVQKHAKQLNCDVNSGRFKDAMRYLWMPRLVERIQAAAAGGTSCGGSATSEVTVGGTAAGASAAAAAAAAACLENSPGASVVTRSTSSSSFTSDYFCGDEKMLHLQGGCVDGEKTTSCGDWMQDADHEIWAMHAQLQPDHDQFQDQDLSGWVQGFSECVSENLWSLEDIWKMQ